MKINWDTTVVNTNLRISVAHAFLEAVEKGLPLAEEHQLKALKEKASIEGWDLDEYSSESQTIGHYFGFEIPRMFGYTYIALLHSIVETRLIALARYLRQKNNFDLKFNDLRGSPIDCVKKYLSKIAKIEVGNEPGWQILQDLQKLRNIIIHHGGSVGIEKKQKAEIQLLIDKYHDHLSVHVSKHFDEDGGELFISVDLCLMFVNKIEKFFQNIFKIAGLKSFEVDINNSHQKHE